MTRRKKIAVQAVKPPVGKRERTRRHVYECALRLFEKKGYTATTINDICAAAEISRATFFLHFPEKAALVGEASLRLGELWERAREEWEPLPAAVLLQRLMEFTYDNMEAPKIAAPMLDDFRQTFGSDTSPGTGPGTMHAHATAIIARAQREGSIISSAAAEVLAHHAIRLTSLYRIFMIGDHAETKALLWRLFYLGASEGSRSAPRSSGDLPKKKS